MALRLIISFRAKPGKGGELLAAFGPRCAEVQAEPGCEQFEVLQSGQDPDRLVLLERWADDAALAAHAEVNRGPAAPGTGAAPGGRRRARGLRVQPHALNALSKGAAAKELLLFSLSAPSVLLIAAQRRVSARPLHSAKRLS